MCIRDSPGANGCSRAAAIAAERGDLEAAIRYYRLSNWSGPGRTWSAS